MPATIQTAAEIEPLIERVREAADRTKRAIKTLLDRQPDGLEPMRCMKFTEMAWPVDGRQLNLVEQINQTWTYLVSLSAVRFLFERHPDAGGFLLNWGTAGGTDILSFAPHRVAAEAFAVVHPANNRKLQKWEVAIDRRERISFSRQAIARPENFDFHIKAFELGH